MRLGLWVRVGVLGADVQPRLQGLLAQRAARDLMLVHCWIKHRRRSGTELSIMRRAHESDCCAAVDQRSCAHRVVTECAGRCCVHATANRSGRGRAMSHAVSRVTAYGFFVAGLVADNNTSLLMLSCAHRHHCRPSTNCKTLSESRKASAPLSLTWQTCDPSPGLWAPPLYGGSEGEQTSDTTAYVPCVPCVASFSHRASRIRPGDSGSSCKRTPIAWDTALVTAASGGMTDVSPTPRTPYG